MTKPGLCKEKKAFLSLAPTSTMYVVTPQKNAGSSMDLQNKSKKQTQSNKKKCFFCIKVELPEIPNVPT
jgi:hypothetical protein